MLDKFFTNAWYKAKAIEKMQGFKRNDVACFEIKGHKMPSATKAKLLNDIAFCRRRFTGQEELPTMLIVNG